MALVGRVAIAVQAMKKAPEPTDRLVLYCWAATDTGLVRAENEDAFVTSAQLRRKPISAWEGSLGPEGWSIVADGIGGHNGGGVASELAVECLHAVLRSDLSRNELVASIEATNLSLYGAMEFRPDLVGMGTTIVGVLLRGPFALVFNVGDSRAYLQSEGELRMISADHVVGGNQLTQCLGGFLIPAAVDPHIQELTFERGDRLLLCTDGLTDELSDAHIATLLNSNRPAHGLIEAALSCGARDNVTALVIELRTAGRDAGDD
jgi:protein phosphatase